MFCNFFPSFFHTHYFSSESIASLRFDISMHCYTTSHNKSSATTRMSRQGLHPSLLPSPRLLSHLKAQAQQNKQPPSPSPSPPGPPHPSKQTSPVQTPPTRSAHTTSSPPDPSQAQTTPLAIPASQLLRSRRVEVGLRDLGRGRRGRRRAVLGRGRRVRLWWVRRVRRVVVGRRGFGSARE